MAWIVMLIKSWVTVVLDFICSTVLASILKKKKNAELLYFMARKVLLIKTIKYFKKYYTKRIPCMNYFFFNFVYVRIR